MGVGTISFDPPPIPLGRPGDLILVAQYLGNGEFTFLPNALCLDIQFFEGARPPTARFRYSQGNPLLDASYPIRIEQVFPLNVVQRNGVVLNDDRLVVIRVQVDGTQDLLFDGFAQTPQADMSGTAEFVTFTAQGTPIREWDTVFPGAIYRDASHPTQFTPTNPTADIPTRLPARFNPSGHPNASPASADSGPDAHHLYPVFLGPYWPENTVNGSTIRLWTVYMAVSYILSNGNPKEDFVSYDLLDFSTILSAYEPIQKGGTIDLGDPSTYTVVPIEAQDLDITGMCWPDALEALIKPHGFEMAFRLSADQYLNPTWYLDIYRVDDTVRLKDLKHQKPGDALAPEKTNLKELRLNRDSNSIANQTVIDTHPVEVECSFILAPLFIPNVSDASNLEQFTIGNPNFTGDNKDKYRVFVLDEAGEKHYDFSKTLLVHNEAADLDSILNTTSVIPNGVKLTTSPYVARRRKPHHDLITLDANNEPLKATLSVSFDYGRFSPGSWKDNVAIPGVWDGTGTWDEVTVRNWKLLDDQVGIRILCKNPNDFDVGTDEEREYATYGGSFSHVADASASGVPLVEYIANPHTTDPNIDAVLTDVPIFRLTCVIHADQDLLISSPKSIASPTTFTIERHFEGRNRFHKQVVSSFSEFAAFINQDQIQLDDSANAQAMADQNRRAHEMVMMGGDALIGSISKAYQVGDKIRSIKGRDMSLVSNAATEQDESAVYPAVISVTWQFDHNTQTTLLSLTDKRAEYATRHSAQHQPKHTPAHHRPHRLQRNR